MTVDILRRGKRSLSSCSLIASEPDDPAEFGRSRGDAMSDRKTYEGCDEGLAPRTCQKLRM